MIMTKEFLSGISAEKIKKLFKEEENPKAKNRLHACMLRKNGMTIEEIAEILQIPWGTIQTWLARIEKGGLDAIYDEKRPGAACKLTDKQIKKLLRDLDKGPQKCGLGVNLWTCPLVNLHIKNTFGVEYNDSSVFLLLKRHNYRLVVPRLKNRSAATPEEIKAFKKKSKSKIKYWNDKGYAIMVMDATHKLIKNEPKKGWSREKHPVHYFGPKKTDGQTTNTQKKKGTKAEKKSHSVTILGAIGENGTHYFEFCDAGNWNNVKSFLLNVHANFGKVLIFMDNARYHIKSGLKQLTKETNGDLQFEFFLKYTPELNPIETQWREFKSKLAGMYAKTASEIKDLLTNGIKNKTLSIVKLHDYLIP